MKIYIIVGSYLLESGYKVLRGYINKDQAQKDLDMIKDVDCNGREWKLEEVECIGFTPDIISEHEIKRTKLE